MVLWRVVLVTLAPIVQLGGCRRQDGVVFQAPGAQLR